MALVSAGVQVSIVDESTYSISTLGTTPLVVVATSENKSNPSGNLAAYTTAANAGEVFLVTSQRELVTNYGQPEFLVSNGTPVHGYELNEYGLYAAYSALGVSNAAYVLRADLDLNQLSSSLVQPSGPPANATLWLDTVNSKFGMLEWNSSTGFREINTSRISGDGKLFVITSTNQISGNEPVTNIGKQGDYAIDATNIDNPAFYKNASGWVEVGSADWEMSWPTVSGTSTYTHSSTNVTFTITGASSGSHVITVRNGNTVSNIAATINTAAITGITASVTTAGYLQIFSNSVASPITLSSSSSILTSLGIPNGGGSFSCPKYIASKHTQVPAGGAWSANGSDPRPTGSIWFKTTSPNNGASIKVNRYSSATQTWTSLTTPIFPSDVAIINDPVYGDPSGGGLGIPASSTYIQSSITTDVTTSQPLYTFKLFDRVAGVSSVTGSTVSPTFVNASNVIPKTYTFTLSASTLQSGSWAMSSPTTVSFTVGNSATANAGVIITAINNAGLVNVNAELTPANKVKITHAAGGVMELHDGANTPLTVSGITISSTGARESDVNAGNIWISNWRPALYTVGSSQPTADPLNGTYWYYNNTVEYDILINNGAAWKGYLLGGTDARGYTLSLTDPAGPIVSASMPTSNSAGDPLVGGDLWVNTSDFENFPRIYRYNDISTTWILIDNTDHTSENGIIFADARWDGSGTVDPITDPLPTIASLLNSNYVDSDCPSYALYPKGTLLFNTRRSGMNVKQFAVNYFPAGGPAVTSTWVSASGNDSNGVAYLGRRAQRAIVVSKMASAVLANTQLLEETRDFNIICAPGYPELGNVLTQLNVNRKETAFVLLDTPMRLAATSNNLLAYGSNLGVADGTDAAAGDALINYEYSAAYYPSGYTQSLAGDFVVVPPTHMALRTIIRSDQKSYPWFAPAGTRRGTVDNVSAIGYIDGQTGSFKSIGVNNGLRDALYQGKVNPITFLTNSGITIYGQKTRSANTSALDRVNVARLIVYLRRKVDLIARDFLFEQNDTVTRKEIKNAIEKELISIKSQRGIYDYSVICDLSNNSTNTIDRNELYVDVAIEPEKSVEFIYIPVRIKNTGDIQAGL